MKEYHVTIANVGIIATQWLVFHVNADRIIQGDDRLDFYTGSEIVASFPKAITIYRLMK